MQIGLHVNYPLFFSDFNKIWIFSIDFGEILKYQISWKSVHWETRFCMWTDKQKEGRTDGQTDKHNKANYRFSQFYKHTEIPHLA